MSLVNPSQSNAGDTIEASDINNPVNQLAAVINGSLDATNLADNAVTGAKLAAGAVDVTKLTAGAIKVGYNEITASITVGTTTDTEVSGLATTITVPAGGRDAELVLAANFSSNVANANHTITVWDGAVGTGTSLRSFFFASHIADINVVNSRTFTARVPAPASGTKTYRVSMVAAGGGSIRMYADNGVRSSLTVELV